MIVEFSVKNFRSIKEMQTISFAATGLKSSSDFSEVDENNIVEDQDMRLLKTVGIYGANASGKSNIIKAIEYFFQAIRNQPSPESNLENLFDPFLYQVNQNEESFFQIVFLSNRKKYRYGFTVKKNPNFTNSLTEKVSREIIVSEWLFSTKERNVVECFTRKNMTVEEKAQKKNEIPPIPYEHTLFLTHSASYDSKSDSANARNYISGWTISNLSGLSLFRRNAVLLLEVEKRKEEFLSLLSSFNLKYDDIKIEKDNNKAIDLILPNEKIFMIKSYINNDTVTTVRLNLGHNESDGTKKLFDLAGLLLVVFGLPVECFVIIDEIDSNFHPSLLIKLIGLFNDPFINKNRSQLLFTSHDTNLMNPAIMRRDQFFFTEKNEDNSTRLYSLADLKGIRNDADFAKQYLAGYYGGIPKLSDIAEKPSE